MEFIQMQYNKIEYIDTTYDRNGKRPKSKYNANINRQ